MSNCEKDQALLDRLATAEKRAALGERAMALLRDQTPEAIMMRRTIADGDPAPDWRGVGDDWREARRALLAEWDLDATRRQAALGEQ